jgi:hypothetical protein
LKPRDFTVQTGKPPPGAGGWQYLPQAGSANSLAQPEHSWSGITSTRERAGQDQHLAGRRLEPKTGDDSSLVREQGSKLTRSFPKRMYDVA